MARRPLPAEHGGLIAIGNEPKGGLTRLDKTFSRVVAPDGEPTRLPTANDQFIAAVAIDVVPANPGSQLAQRMGQEWLPLEIIVGRIDMAVALAEFRLGEPWVGRRAPGRSRRGRGRFVNQVESVGLNRWHLAFVSAPPMHFDRHAVRGIARRKYPHGIVAREVSSSADHFLGLKRDGSAPHNDPGPDAGGIAGPSAEAHGDARRGAIITVKQRSRVEAIDDHVQIAVAIEVAEGDSL